MVGQSLTFLGLLLTLVGATVLFVYNMPRRKVGRVLLYGEFALRVLDASPDEISTEESLRLATVLADRAKRLSRVGFGLVALGSLLQMIAVCV